MRNKLPFLRKPASKFLRAAYLIGIKLNAFSDYVGKYLLIFFFLSKIWLGNLGILGCNI